MMDLDRLNNLIAQGESIELEFKSDQDRLPDSSIYEEVVALANTQGGVLLLGVENDGTVTGLHSGRGSADPMKLQAAIFNNTVPRINTRPSVVSHPGGLVAAVEVDPYPEICSTAHGRSVRRVIGSDGKPATVPFYPHEHVSRRSDLGLLDYSAQLVEEAGFSALDPLEFERLRQTIVRLRGDRTLLELPDEDMAKALRLVETQGDRLIPNVAGVLLLGREESIRDLVPTHEAHFQVLDARGDVRVNDAFHGPLLQVLEDVEARFSARNEEREVMVGLIRLPIPDYSLDGFREAVNNAVLHRDYARLGQVYVQWHHDHLLITSPGGFPEGVTVDNLLVHEPKPRNPRLAEAFKRAGLIEQTGRGVDRIYMGQVRYGRPIPDYTRSAGDGVRVVLRGGEASLEFAALVYEQDKLGASLALDELIALNGLFFERRIDSRVAGSLIQKGTSEGLAVLERLHERGLVAAQGKTRARVYTLSAHVYKRLHMKAEYVRAKGFEPLQCEQMILDYVRTHGRITRSEAVDLCHLTPGQAKGLLKRMTEQHPQLQLRGQRRGSHYVWQDE